MNRTLVDYYRCPEASARCSLHGEHSPHLGYFRFGPEAICYGSITSGSVRPSASEELHDALNDVVVQPGTVHLSFDPDHAVADLRFERYCGVSGDHRLPAGALASKLYYLARPLLGVSVRRHLQRFRLRNWRCIAFPRWPVDRSVEQVHETLLRLCLQANAGKEIPFIWFWPEGFPSCVAITHDVETTRGRDFCSALMDLDESFGIKSSFQLIPERRYSLGRSFLESIRSRGFEVNVHDLNHDGQLFASKSQFLERVRRINQHARAFGALGFRSGALYRNLDWYEALDFSYEMSVPNTARLDPQRGGCCTTMPYFVGDIVEIPLTTTQDYSLLHILGDYSMQLWRQQLEIIGKGHGIATFNIHPDYVIDPEARRVYVHLLQHIVRLRSEGKIWLALPRDVDRWWRNRAQMRLVRRGSEWTIEGPDSQRARVAYACLRGHELEYSWTTADRRPTSSSPYVPDYGAHSLHGSKMGPATNRHLGDR
jgi:hypothetical protein